jgi:hypothetical protein
MSETRPEIKRKAANVAEYAANPISYLSFANVITFKIYQRIPK